MAHAYNMLDDYQVQDMTLPLRAELDSWKQIG